MRCYYCNHDLTRVVDKRDIDSVVRRRRECLKCGKRFTTYEKAQEIDFHVVKKDGRREPFLPDKLFKGLRIAFQKRPISSEKIQEIVARIENKIKNDNSLEVSSDNIGKMVMKELKKIDRVAYIRFASVYRSFEDIKEFEKEIKALKR